VKGAGKCLAIVPEAVHGDEDLGEGDHIDGGGMLPRGILSMANRKSREGRWRGGKGFAHQTRTKFGSEAWRLSFTDPPYLRNNASQNPASHPPVAGQFTDGAGNKRKTAPYQGSPAARDTVFSQQSVSRTSRMGQRSQSGDFLQMVFPRCTIWAW